MNGLYASGRTSSLCLGVLLALVAPCEAAVLTFVDSYVDGANGVDGLAGAASVAVSPEGQNVYVASGRASAVTTFDRNPSSGRLIFIDGVANGPSAEGLGGAFCVAVSPDGAQVYVAGKSDSALAVFNRDPAAGRLMFSDAHFDGVDGNDGLGGATSIAVSPEGTDVYVAGESDSSVAAFRRDPLNGSLAFLEAHFDAVILERPRGVVVSPDGANVYAVGNRSNSVVKFARDPASGRLMFVEALVQGIDVQRGLMRPTAVTVSPDGMQVYVASLDHDLAIFGRDPFTGRLTLQQNAGVSRGGPITLTLSLDAAYLYVASFISSTVGELNVFTREPETGTVTFVEAHPDVGTASGLTVSGGVAASPDGKSVYVASSVDNSLALFTTLTPCPGDCDLDDVVSISELVTGINIALDSRPLDDCRFFDQDEDDEILLAVGNGLTGCAR